MNPKLIENSTFLRYYEKWQNDPTSVVFAAISEIFRTNDMVDEAIQIAVEGLKHHPILVSGRLALAKALMAKGETAAAHEQAMLILEQIPNHEEAKHLLEDEITDEIPNPEVNIETEDKPSYEYEGWHTLTMARICASQGHPDMARKIYDSILAKQPNNDAAAKELKELSYGYNKQGKNP